MSGTADLWSARRVVALCRPLGAESAGVEEQPRCERARDNGEHHGEGDTRTGEKKGQDIGLHASIVGSGHGPAVGPKVTRTLGRRRFVALVAAGLAAACTPMAQARTSSTASPIRPLGANPMRGIWPAQYISASPQVREAYAWAATHENVLRYIPCYCGCGANGHKNNYDCFVSSRGENGWITMDLHGLNCGTCVSIALETAAMLGKGLTVRQMRTAIDARWSSTGPSTPTPLP